MKNPHVLFTQDVRARRQLSLECYKTTTGLANQGKSLIPGAAFSRALELDPTYLDVHYNLADFLESQGQCTAARIHWQIYVQYDPSSPWGIYARGQLD